MTRRSPPRARDLDVCHVDELPDRIEPASIDVVTLWDVIEHVVDPLGMLTSAVSMVRPGGLVVLETPDVSFPLRPFTIAVRRVIEPIRWSDVLYYADHQTYFSGRGLSTLMGRSGLEVADQQGLRSPSTKIAGLMRHWAEQGSGAGRLGPLAHGPLDRSMRALRLTNKLVVVGRKSDPESRRGA